MFRKEPTRAHGCCDCSSAMLCILAVVLSPLAVIIRTASICTWTVLLNVILFCAGLIPGMLHAWWIILGPHHFWNLIWSIVAVILSPLAVFCYRGCGWTFFLNVLLWCLGVIPGFIHALFVIWD